MLTTAKLTSAEELAAYMLRISGARTFHVSDRFATFKCATNSAESGGVLVVKQVMSVEADMVADPDCDAIVFHLLLSGQCEIRSELGMLKGHTGSGHIFPTRQEIGLVSSPAALRLGIKVSRPTFHDLLREHFDISCSSELAFTPTFNSLSPIGAYIKSTAESLLMGSALQPNVAKATQANSDNLLLLLLEGLPHTYSDLVKAKPADLLPRHVRRAIDLMEEHAAQGLSVLGLAKMMNVSVRALQYAFVQHCGTTPMRYMHDIRLRRAVHDLTREPDTTPQDIAARWGFSNYGRFSSACYRMFGKRPKDFHRESRSRR